METLTLEIARTLKGKKIRYEAFSYWCNEPPRGTMVVGEVISKWDYYKTQPCPGYESRTAEWQTWMSLKQIEGMKNNILLLDAEGKWEPHHIVCHLYDKIFEEPTFTIGDADRAVSYEVLDKK